MTTRLRAEDQRRHLATEKKQTRNYWPNVGVRGPYLALALLKSISAAREHRKGLHWVELTGPASSQSEKVATTNPPLSASLSTTITNLHSDTFHELIMATTAAIRPLAFASKGLQPLSRGFSTTIGRRAFLTRPRAIARPAFNKVRLRQSFRRHQSSETPKPKPRGVIRSMLVWSWRGLYLSALGGLVYLGYGIWIMRHPIEQMEPDPNKKTLVILGMCSI